MKQILLALDQLLNALLGGWADETLSSRAWRMDDGVGSWARTRKSIDRVFFWQKDHCYEAWLSERLRLHFPPELR